MTPTTTGAVAATFVFIDSRVAGWQALADALPPGTNWRLVDAGADGLAQVAQALAGQQGVAAVHILSHGAEGSVQLGASVLTADALAAHAADLAAIGAALDADGDILLYGCDAGAGSAGAALVDTLAALTGADVAASTDVTGAAALGGNWVLERSSGAVEAQAPGAGLEAWAGTLATSQTFGFTSGTTGATDFGGPYSMQVTQEAGDHVLVLQANAGTLAVVEESSYTGADDPVLDGKTMAVDAAAPGSVLPTSIALQLKDGNLFDLTSLSLLDAAGTLSQLLITTNKGPVTVSVSKHGEGTTIVLPDDSFLKGITTAVLSDPDGDVLVVQLDDIVLSNIRIPSPPVFENASSSVDLAQNAVAFDLKGRLGASDADAGDTLTWSIAGNPAHGTVTVANATATAPSGSAVVAPGGTLTYQPAPGFAGTDSVTVQVSDGTASATKTITIRVAPQQPDRPDLDAGADTGGSSTDDVTGANSLKFTGTGTGAGGDNDSTVRVFVDQNGNGAYDAGETSGTDKLSGGAWSVDNLSTTGLSSGTYDVYAVVTSADGTLSSSVSAPLAVTIDHTAPATTFGNIMLSADRGPSAVDFTTNVAAQTITATLSAALQAGDVVQGSTDNGLGWTDVTSMVSGTSLSWTGATLVAGGRILLRVVDQHGNQGAATPQDYLLDTTAPTNGIAVAAFVDDPNNDGIVNAARQELGGALSANLAAGEFVEVSLNGGATWTTATASTGSRSWTLDDIDLAGNGTLKVRVADQAGNHGPAFERDYVLDLVAPTATVPASRQLLAPSGVGFTVTVTYADAGSGIDATTLGIGDIDVKDANGGSLAVVGYAAGGNVATYTVLAPGGSWDAQDAGTYTVAINPNAVRDVAGNAVAGNAAAGTIDVLFSTAPAVGALSLSDDKGSSDADFLTNVAAQTIHATLSKPLAAGDVVEGSTDNGQSWVVITGKVAGTALAWDGVVLGAGGTIVVKVTDANGLAGTPASHAYTVDTAVPVQAVATAGFSADSGADGDFVTNVASQVLQGTLDAPLGAGEFVEISFNGGMSWIAASAAGSDWSLGGITLAGSGLLQVRVADAAGNHGMAWEHAYRFDGQAPTAGTPVRADLLDPAGASFTFAVTYADVGSGIDPATVGTGNVSVAGPAGILTVTGATLSGNTVTYTVAAPGGGWDPLDAGSYVIGINGGGIHAAVADVAGNVVAARPAATVFEVAFTPAPDVSGLKLADDTGTGDADFLTNVAAQTIHATLSRALAAGDVVEGSLDNGAHWTVITDKVAGTALAWDGVTLNAGGTIIVRVSDANGLAGATASHAYTLDTGVPAQAPFGTALAVDSGAAGDFVTNVAAQDLSGKLSAPLGAGEFVEVSLDGGAGWTTAATSGSDWSLSGVTLSGSGLLQVRVSDAAGNHGAAWSHDYLLDTAAPTAGTPVRTDLLAPEGASFTFTVTYADGGAGIDPATIGTGNVSVTGPGGTLAVTGATASGNTVTYTVAAPGGGWDAFDAGTYTIGINASVKDLAGNMVATNAAAHTFDVLYSTAPSVSALALADDTGTSDADFLTNVAAQTIHATLSRALATGEVVEGSLDNGQSWTVITGKVGGTALAWDGVTLNAGGTIIVRVSDANGLSGATASHAYTLDTGVPAQAINDVALAADSGAAGDFVTNVAAQDLSGKLSAPLGAGEFVEVSLDGGAGWTMAATSGSDWSLSGVTLAGSGTLQVRVSDAAGNHGAPWSHDYLLDTAAPTAGTPVRADMADPSGASFTFTVTYADNGAGIDPATIGTGNVSVTGPGGALTVLGATAAGNAVTYTVAAPGGAWDPLDAGSYTIGINASVKDLAGNTVAANAAAHAFTVGVNSAPVLGGTFATPSIGDTATTAPFAGVTVADADGDTVMLTISYAAANGTLSGAGLAGTAGNYTLSGSAAAVQEALRALVFTPAENQVATGTVATIFALAASDGRATAHNDATVVTTAPVAPTASIALSDTALAAGETATLTVTFSEAVSGLTAGALTLPGGTLGALASSDGGRTWSATFTPGANVVQEARQGVLDLSGVRDAGGLAGSGVASGPSYTVNTARPTATLAIDDTALTAGETARVTVVFSEAVTGFTLADLTAANGTLSNLASRDGGVTWTATLTPAANVAAGAGTVRLDLAGVQNGAGNAGGGVVQSNPYTVDTLPPDTGTDPGNGNGGGVIDGVPVLTGTLVDPLTGLVNNTLTVPAVSSTHEGLANIPLAASAHGVTSTLTIGLPGGAGLQASGPATLLDNAMAQQDLANRIGSNTAGDADGRAMAQHASDFLHTLGADVLVHTLTLAPELPGSGGALARIATMAATTAAAARPDIAITGGTDAGVALALVIDAGALPAGTTLQLNDVQFAAVAGAVTLRGGAGANYVVGDSASQNILLGEGDDTLFGGGGDDVIGSTGGNDALHGDGGNDTLAGGIGNDALHGGTGNDVLQGGRSASRDWQFVLKGGALQALHQTATFAPDATETLAATALDGGAAGLAFLAAGQGTLTDIALLYQAAFGRAPDVGGLNYFLAHGVGAAGLARAFATSAEWAAEGLDTLSDGAFVQQLYGEVLDRAGDSAGMAFWTGKLGEGAMSRADVLLALALSDEHRGHYADGIVVAAAGVTRENGWIAGSGDDRLEGGAGSDLLVGGDGIDTVVYAGKLADYRFLLGADGTVQVADKANADVDTLSGIELGEFSDGTVDLAFTQAATATLRTVGLLYQAVLDRAGDAGGFGWWSGLKLDTGALVAAFTGSAEFAAHYGAMPDADFVAALYANSGLDAGAAGGSAAWIAMLHDHSRAELVGSWIAQDAVQQAQSGTGGLWLV